MSWSKGGYTRPYVHSGADHFTDNGTISLSEQIVAQQDIENGIQQLESIRDALKSEADKFLMGMDVNEANAQLLKSPVTYAGIAAELIQNPTVIKSLVVPDRRNVSNKALKNIFEKDNSRISKKIISEINLLEEDIPIKDAALIIAKSIGNMEGTLTHTGTRLTKTFSFSEDAVREIEKMTTDKVFNRLSSSQGKIVNIVEKLLSTSNLVKNSEDIKSSVDNFMSVFSDLFLEEVKSKVLIYYKNFTPEQYLKDLRKLLEDAITKDIIDQRNASGIINEDILSAVYKADNTVTLTITATGNQKEQDIIKNFPHLKQMNTFHDANKQSLTDLVLENKKGMVVRAQAKTSLREYQVKGEEQVRILNHLQRSIKLYELLNRLNEMNIFSINNIDDICYAVANALWFNTHISVSGERDTGYFETKRAHYKDLLPEVIDALNMALARQAPMFLGISLSKTEDQIIVDAKGSNIFYVENGNLVPTYIELDEIIADLRDYAQKAEGASKNLRFVIERKDVAWNYKNAKNFFLQKYHDSTYNPEPGFEQGASAMSSLYIHGNFSALTEFESYTLG